MTKVYVGYEFEALKIRYQDQLELLRTLTRYDFRIFSGFLTLQLILGGWLAKTPIPGTWAKIGLLVINASLALLACVLLYNQYKRRLEVITIVRNISEAFGFNEKGVYLSDKSIDVVGPIRPWFLWYILGIVIAFGGFCLILFGGPSATVP